MLDKDQAKVCCGAFQFNLFHFYSLCFLVAGAHHLYEYFAPALRPDYPPLRHIAFVGINITFAFLMIKRTIYFLPIIVLFSVQQLVGHGTNVVHGLSNSERILYTDWVVVVMAPLLLIAYSLDVLNNRLKPD